MSEHASLGVPEEPASHRADRDTAANSQWRPQCYVCSRFVAMEAFDCFYDYYAGAWEEGYTACPEHGGPSRERVLEIRAERAAYEGLRL